MKTSRCPRATIAAVALFSVLVLTACSSGDGGGGGVSPAITHTIGGTLTGLGSGKTVVLQNNGGDNLTLSANGDFTFATAVTEGSNYNVTVLTQPTGQTCTASSNSGVVGGADVTTITVVCSTVVEALYPDAANWNDYVLNDGASMFAASGTACTGTETGDHNACLHGGELRKVTVAGYSSCAGLAAIDALGAFDWTCDDSVIPVRMVSTGLKRDKNLSDLVDFAAVAWRQNAVTVSDGATALFSTDPATWWANPVSVANSGGGLYWPGMVYIVTANPNVAYQLYADRAAFVVQPGVEISAPAADPDVVNATANNNFLWLEGAVHVQGTGNGITLSTRFSRVRNVAIRGSGGAWTQITAGLQAYELQASRVLRVTAIKCAFAGVYFGNAGGNLIEDITVSDNDYYGLYLAGDHNVVSGVKAHGNGESGISYGGPQTIQQIYAGGNAGAGIFSLSGKNSRVANVTAVNNATSGLVLGNSGTDVSDASLVANLASINNTYTGLGLSNSGGLANPAPAGGTFANLAVAHVGGSGIDLANSSNNRFTGLLKVGNNTTDCLVTTGTNPGLATTTCVNQGASDATLTTGVSLAASIKGKVTSDDTVNAGDSNGLAAYDTLTDWLGFANEARGWGRDGSAFPNADHRGRCAAGTDCRIWDLSLAQADSVVRGVLPKLLNGDAANTLTHVWSVAAPASQTDCTAAVPGSVFAGGACSNTFLRNSVEMLGDGAGNDNGLCESNERCLYTPNIGAYQGHGALVSAGSFTDGDTLSGIVLVEYAVNGR